MNIAVRSLAVVSLIYGIVLGAPAGESSVTSAPAKVVNQFYNQNDGGFQYAYELSDGTKVNQEGNFGEQPDGSRAHAMKGSYSFVGPDGIKYTVNYYADKTGFHPTVEGLKESTGLGGEFRAPSAPDSKGLLSLLG